MIVLETARQRLRWLSIDDAAFIVEILNDPAWLRFIGDRGVRTLEDARKYILSGPLAMIERHGFGLYLAQRKSDATPMGICGLIKRDSLDDVDIGFAYLPQFCRHGYALEAAASVMVHGKRTFGLTRIVAITSPDNEGSIRLLEKLGLKFERMLRLPKDDDETMLFAWNV